MANPYLPESLPVEQLRSELEYRIDGLRAMRGDMCRLHEVRKNLELAIDCIDRLEAALENKDGAAKREECGCYVGAWQ